MADQANPPAHEGASQELARRAGAAEAEAADLRWKLEESLGRERLFLERALRAEDALEDLRRAHDHSGEQLGRFAQFHRAVEMSAAWRLIQSLRRLVGREW